MSKIGLILSGGLAKGAYQTGALQAINEFIKPDEIACCSAASVGVLNTYAYMSGTLDTALDAWYSVSGSSAVLVTELLRSPLLQNSIKDLTASGSPVTKDFYFPLVSLHKRKLIYYNLRNIPPSDYQKFLSASVAVPLYNKACAIQNEKFFDGAIADNIPVYPLLKHNCDYLICIYFNDHHCAFGNESTDKKIIRLTFSDSSVLSNSMLVKKDTIEFMIKEGYKQTKNTLDFVFYRGIRDVKTILERIEDLNKVHAKKRQLRPTVDAAISSLNKITRKFADESVLD